MNKKMRVFPPEMQDYEKVFQSTRYLSRLRIDRIESPKGFDSIAEYRDTFKGFLIESSFSVWDTFIKMSWLSDKFKYTGYRNGTQTGVCSRSAFSVFTKELIGSNTHFISYSFCYNKIVTYFKELYPLFSKSDPFKNPEKFKYPFKNITLDFLVLVHQLPERIDLLNYADEHKMNFTSFADFVINYIGKYNDSEGKDVFGIIRSKRHPMYVKRLK